MSDAESQPQEFHGSVQIQPETDRATEAGQRLRRALDELGGAVPDTGQARETPRHREGVAAGSPVVAGRCPGCGWRSLFLGSGGHVTCARLDCPAPCAADDLLDPAGSGDTVQATDTGQAGEHPVARMERGIRTALFGSDAEVAAARAETSPDTACEPDAVMRDVSALLAHCDYVQQMKMAEKRIQIWRIRELLAAGSAAAGQAREPRVTVRNTQETTEEWRARQHRENPCACGGAFWVGSHSLNGCVGMVEEPLSAPDVAAPCPQHPPIPAVETS